MLRQVRGQEGGKRETAGDEGEDNVHRMTMQGTL